MTLSWYDASEIAAGLLVANRLPPAQVRPELFPAPYDDIVKDYIAGVTDTAELIERHGIGPMQALLEAEERINGTGDKANWVKLLESSYALFHAGSDLEVISKKMKKGEQCDLSQLREIADKAQSGESTHLKPMTEVTAEEIVFEPSGWKAFDDHMVGLPKHGLVVVGARPGVGKTWWGLSLSMYFLRHYKDKKVAFYSAEMTDGEVKERLSYFVKQDDEEVRKYPPDSIMSRFLIDASSNLDAAKIVNRSASVENLGLVVADFSDLFVNEINEPEYTRLYMALSKGAKSLGVPVVLLSQLNGTYVGGLPRPQAIRYCIPATAQIMDGTNGEHFTPEEAETHDFVLSLTEDGLSPMPFTIAKNVPQNILKITTWSGNVIRCGDTHPLLCGQDWKMAKDLSVGDMVATIKSYEPPMGISYSKERAKLLGYMIGDGYLPARCHGAITWAEPDVDVIKDFEYCIQQEFPDISISKRFHTNCWYLSPINRDGSRGKVTSFAKWLEEMGVRGQNSFTFRVPKEVFGWDNESIAAFLSALFTADGCVRSCKTIGYHSVSSGLLIDIKQLLTRFGILAMISGNELAIANKFYAKLFIDRVGFIGPKQEKGMRLFCDVVDDSQYARTELLPLNVSQEIRSFTSKKLPKDRRITLSRAKRLLQKKSFMGGSLFDYFWQVSDEFWWDTIKSIEFDGIEDTWDIEVPFAENFVVDGFITHNTRLAEALGWMIVMLWNPSEDSFATVDNGEDNLPILDDEAYMIVWKSRGGFRNHLDECPGAIAVPYKGMTWHPTKGRWYSLRKEATKQSNKRTKKN